MSGSSGSPFARAGDDEHAEEALEGLRKELSMGDVREPVPVDLEDLRHPHAATPEEPGSDGEVLAELIAHEHPPVTTDFVGGALAEHAEHASEAPPEDPPDAEA